MFSYYGTKARVAGKYPRPVFDAIVEPFAGAAGYSCAYPDRNVALYDANPKIVAVWQYLIAATPADICGLPTVHPGDSLNDMTALSDAERWLIGFCINPASTTPKVTASARSAWPRYQAKLAAFVPKIKHWTAEKASWHDVPNRIATWHIDPPYQFAGKYYYGFSTMDFTALGAWCRTRSGQVMVCENVGADWLPFRPFLRQRGMTKTQVEAIWTNDRPPAKLVSAEDFAVVGTVDK